MSRNLHTTVAIVGANAPGIIAAVRAAREGLEVILVSSTERLGGSLPSLGAVETHYQGRRAPLLHEFTERIREHYRSRYGENSEQFSACTRGSMLTFEPHVAEGILSSMVEAEDRITVLLGYHVVRADSVERTVREIVVRPSGGGKDIRITAEIYADSTYEGDLLAHAKVPCRIGRENHIDFNEPNAGQIFSRWIKGLYPNAAVEGKIQLAIKKATTVGPLPGSSGIGDGKIQSYSCRFCLTDDPSNQVQLSSPPTNYDRSVYTPLLLSAAEKAKLRLPFHHRFLIQSLEEMIHDDHVFHGHALPNRKRSWNATNLTEGSHSYPTANWEQRGEIAARHRDHALGLMWFLQNDPEVPLQIRTNAQRWSLAKDEFVETAHVPPLYIREARRLAGRKVFTENDALIAPGLQRAPICHDSIAITEFSLDSLACSMERCGDSLCDGQLFQMEVSRPGQVSFDSLLPIEVDNLLVITPVSATHVGWGTVRQTPTLMHIAESAAFAWTLAVQAGTPPASIDRRELQRTLVENRLMVTFFNDVDMAETDAWLPAVQFFGTKGFFDSYDARPRSHLSGAVAKVWCAAATRMANGDFSDPAALAHEVHAAENEKETPVALHELKALLQIGGSADASTDKAPISRATACHHLYSFIFHRPNQKTCAVERIRISETWTCLGVDKT